MQRGGEGEIGRGRVQMVRWRVRVERGDGRSSLCRDIVFEFRRKGVVLLDLKDS